MVGKSWNILLENIYQGKVDENFLIWFGNSFFCFLDWILSNAFGNSIKIWPIIDSKNISSNECLKVLNYGNIIEYPNLTLGKPFWIFLRGKNILFKNLKQR